MEFSILELFVMLVALVTGLCLFIPADAPERPQGNGTFTGGKQP